MRSHDTELLQMMVLPFLFANVPMYLSQRWRSRSRPLRPATRAASYGLFMAGLIAGEVVSRLAFRDLYRSIGDRPQQLAGIFWAAAVSVCLEQYLGRRISGVSTPENAAPGERAGAGGYRSLLSVAGIVACVHIGIFLAGRADGWGTSPGGIPLLLCSVSSALLFVFLLRKRRQAVSLAVAYFGCGAAALFTLGAQLHSRPLEELSANPGFVNFFPLIWILELVSLYLIANSQRLKRRGVLQ